MAFVRSKASEASAQTVAGILGDLRGVATKVGQMASYVDGLIPPEHHEAFEKHLGSLRTAAPRSSAAQIRRTVEEELGRPVEAVFAAWDDDALASASIGQVHRARLFDGRAVAVKVQHHGVAAAMEADLKNAGLLDASARAFGMGRFEVGRFVDEIRQRFREELDYELEARRLRRFAALHEGRADIRLPRVVEEASGARVLTTELLEGRSFEAAVEAAPELRRAWAATLWHFVYGSIMCGGVFNADPHPGNYRFFDDGAVGFLDFGCVQELSPAHHRAVVAAHHAAGRGDFAGFEAHMATILRPRPGAQRDQMAEYLRLAIAPILDSPFHLTRGYASEVVTGFRRMVGEMTKLRRSDFAALPEGVLFLNRLQFGFYSVLARLDVRVDYAEVERGFLPRAEAVVDAFPGS